MLSNGVFDDLGYITVLLFGQIAKLLFDNARKVNSHERILDCQQHGFNLSRRSLGHPLDVLEIVKTQNDSSTRKARDIVGIMCHV